MMARALGHRSAELAGLGKSAVWALIAGSILSGCGGSQDTTGPSDDGTGQEPTLTVEVTPTTVTLYPGDTVSVEATVKDAAGNRMFNQTLNWSSSNPAITAVQADPPPSSQSAIHTARVMGLAGGSATITVTSGSAQGSVAVSVVLLQFVSVDAGGQHTCGVVTSGDEVLLHPTILLHDRG